MGPSTWLTLDRSAGDLEGQIYRSFRERVLNGQMAGQRLASTRSLAAALGVARSTVVKAYDRLKAEGFIQASGGSATRAVAIRPSLSAQGAGQTVSEAPRLGGGAGKALFKSGIPDLSHFPHAAWARCLGARARSLRLHDLGYASTEGLPELQSAILDHVSTTRGVSARPEQVMIVPSTGAAIDLLARVLIKPERDDIVWMEEPGYKAAHGLFRAAGARLVPIPCDAQGIDVDRATGGLPRLIYTTPSHQYPTGVTMSLNRRLALLEIARQTSAVVVEDDYDKRISLRIPTDRRASGYRSFRCRRLSRHIFQDAGTRAAGRLSHRAAMAGGGHGRRPAAEGRHGLDPRAGSARRLHARGALRAHVRRMNGLYAPRMAATVEALGRHCGHRLELGEGSDGLHLATWFRDTTIDDEAVARTLSANGMAMEPMSQFHLGQPRHGLLFGIARVDGTTVDADVRQLGALLDGIFAGNA